MNRIFDVAAYGLRTLIKLSLFALVGVLLSCLLLIGLSAALLTLVWSLLTGRRPAAFQTFVRFRQASRHFQSRTWPGREAPPNKQNADIVDVQAHEVRSALDKPH